MRVIVWTKNMERIYSPDRSGGDAFLLVYNERHLCAFTLF